MSQKCIKIIICVSFLGFSCVLFYLSFTMQFSVQDDYYASQGPILMFSNPEVQYKCPLNNVSEQSIWPLKTPSLESLIRASSAVEGQELRFSGLAVFSNLTDACQPPVDVSKSNIHVNKIALIYIANQQKCPLSHMAVNAQNAGYTAVVYVTTDSHLPSTDNETQSNTQDKLLIPVSNVEYCYVGPNGWPNKTAIASFLLNADRTNVEISLVENTEALSRMQKYLNKLYCWFLLGPVITLEWLRRTKKFCCMSGGQQVNEERGHEDEDTVGKCTWTVPTNFSKLIRSDWFASNMYLLILGVVVPYCSFDVVSGLLLDKFIYFTTYNTVCTISNLLFIIILNKRKSVTRYVFYISVCMICAYIESDIVAVFYFMLNSEGSLINLKLVALRTVAIGLTLTLSLSSSMHIVRKLAKPQESLFEGLGEK